MYPSGRVVNFIDIQGKDVDIEDIAHHLSHVNRYSGGTRVPYSVCNHSILVAYLMRLNGASIDGQLLGLMHDASEAYINDITSPLKRLLPTYRDIEANITKVIQRKFMLTEDLEQVELLAQCDHAAFFLEASQLTRRVVKVPVGMVLPTDEMKVLPPEEARRVFLTLFKAYSS